MRYLEIRYGYVNVFADDEQANKRTDINNK